MGDAQSRLLVYAVAAGLCLVAAVGLISSAVMDVTSARPAGRAAAGPAPSPSASPLPSASPSASPSSSPSATSTVLTGRPLAGRTVVLDPGHNRDNVTNQAKIGQLLDAGGAKAACDTVGATSADGFAESAFALRTANALKRRLEALGAEVVLTRTADKGDGPCFPDRAATADDADVLLSLHAEGLPAAEQGFTVLRPAPLEGYTDDIAEASARFGRAVRDALVADGLTASTARGEDGLLLRKDVGLLNRSDVPALLVSAGNLANAQDAARLRSGAGQELVAAALAKGIVGYLG